MKDLLAKKLLYDAMDWDYHKVDEEKFYIQLFADLKYDNYQMYSQGMRYIESLALWLHNFDKGKDRDILYKFIKQNLIYISADQVRSLVESVYCFHITPILLKKAKLINGSGMGIVANKELFNKLIKSTLFLGLSDGSHIDIFRRANPHLSHEQISVYYDLSKPKIEEMIKGLPGDVSHTFFLMDDFSGSGTSFVRKEEDKWKGKVVKFLDMLNEYGVSVKNVDIHVLLYVSTKKAIENIKSCLGEYSKDKDMRFDAIAIHHIDTENSSFMSADFMQLLKKYYEKFSMVEIEDIHFKKGNHDKPFLGFNEGALPLVLYHNTPNNALPIIWFNPRRQDGFRGLFPRVSRHKEDV